MRRAAVVTGAGSGIGRACAEALAARGLHVLAVGRRREPLEETVAGLGSGEVVSADISTDAGIGVVAAAAERHEIAAIVHAAGRESVTAFADTDREELRSVFATNLFAPILLTRALAAHLTEPAAVVMISSIAAVRGRDRHLAYASSKAALIGMTRNLAVELAPTIRVNCVVPGPVQTPMLQQYLSEYLGDCPHEQAIATMQTEAARVPLQRIAEAQEIATTVSHLALDATAVTGAILPVDLGYTAR